MLRLGLSTKIAVVRFKKASLFDVKYVFVLPTDTTSRQTYPGSVASNMHRKVSRFCLHDMAGDYQTSRQNYLVLVATTRMKVVQPSVKKHLILTA